MKKYHRPYPTIKNIISNKDYDYVECRENPNGRITFFAGCFAVNNGKIIPLDNEYYDYEQEVIASEEWNDIDREIYKGLTIII